MTIRIAAVGVSHWHALNDAAYLRHLLAMPDVELVAIQDADAGILAKRAAEVGNPPTFADHGKMLAAVRPDFVLALGRSPRRRGSMPSSPCRWRSATRRSPSAPAR
jgi:predicted dehydrogenase